MASTLVLAINITYLFELNCSVFYFKAKHNAALASSCLVVVFKILKYLSIFALSHSLFPHIKLATVNLKSNLCCLIFSSLQSLPLPQSDSSIMPFWPETLYLFVCFSLQNVCCLHQPHSSVVLVPGGDGHPGALCADKAGWGAALWLFPHLSVAELPAGVNFPSQFHSSDSVS